MIKLLIHILITGLLASCASDYKFGDATILAVGVAVIAVEVVEDNRQHKCNMDITQCAKYGLKQDE